MDNEKWNIMGTGGQFYLFVGMAADIPDLPTEGVGDGSVAFTKDTKEMLMFDLATQTWM